MARILDPASGAGFVYVARVRALVQNLPALDNDPSVVLYGANRARKFLSIQNVGSANAYWSHERKVTSTKRFTIAPGAVLNSENAPISPANAIYVAGAAGAILESYEVIQLSIGEFETQQF